MFEGTDVRQNPANFKPVGTGAFRFVEYIKGDRIVYEKNPGYWRAGKPYADKIIIKIIPNEETAVLAIQNAEIDNLFWLRPESFKKLQARPEIAVIMEQGTKAAPAITWLYFNLDHPALKNLKVRQAIAHAIDRTKIAQVARLEIGGRAGVGPVCATSTWAYDPNLQPSYPYDPKKAEQLLDEAGFPRKEGGIRLKLALNDLTGLVYNLDAEMIKDQLKVVGIEVDHQLLSLATANEALFNKREFDLGIRQYFAGPDPSIALLTTFHAEQIGKGTYTNAAGYKNPEADKLILQAQIEADPTKRRQMMLDWQKIIMTDLPGYPIIYDIMGHAVRKEWAGVPSNVWGSQTMRSENIWWTKGTPIEVPKTTVTTPTTTTTVAPPAPDMTTPTIAVVVIAIVAAAGLYVMRKRQAKPKAPP